MKAADQKKVAEAIAQDENPREAVRRFLDQDKAWKHKPDNGTVSFLRSLETWKQKMKGRLPEIKSVSPDDADRIRKVMGVLKELLQKAEPQPGTTEAKDRNCAKKAGQHPPAHRTTAESTTRPASGGAVPSSRKRTPAQYRTANRQVRHECRS